MLSKGNMVFRGEYYFLSNMSPSVIGFKYKGVFFKFKCVESAFQALKCVNIDDMYAFQDMSGSEAKAKGKKVKLKSNWNVIKVSVMHSLLKLKFKDDFRMQLLLKVTCDIVENNSWGDNFWGVYNGYGKNMLGELLMKIRDEGCSGCTGCCDVCKANA